MKKSTLKNILLVGVSATLAATIAIGGTLAYLTKDEKPLSNVFTVGDIDIALREETGIFGEGGEVKSDETRAEYNGVMPGDYLKKEVTVENTGKNPAYVAVTVTLNNAVAINAAIDDVYGDGTEGGQAMYDFIFDGWGINQDPRPGKNGDDARGVIDGTYGLPEHVMQVDFTKTITDYWLYGTGNWFHGVDEKANQYWVDSVSVENFGGGYYAKNMNPDQICYTYYIYLESGEETTLFNGLNVPAEFNNKQMKMFDGLEIDIDAAAIQADNMAIADEYKKGPDGKADPDGKAKTAFSILAGEIETPEYSNKPTGTVVSTADGLIAALENGEDVVLTKNIKIDPASMSNAYGKTGINVKNGQTIDGNGYTIDIAGADGTWDSGINTTGGTIKNLTVTGSFRGIFINHNSTHSEPVVLDNVTIDGTTYTISCDQGNNQTLKATNSTFNGWTSYAATLGSAEFIDCNFGEGNGYAFCRPYAPTTFVGCNFEADYEIDPLAAVTFENCTIGGVELTADNLATLVTSNIANATVK